jgi:TonB family protein
MIPRLLVPEKLSPVSAAPTDGRKRAWTILDERQIIQGDMPVKALEADSKIPLHMPLGVLGERILIPREAVPGTLELPAPNERLVPTDADERIAVPVDARPKELIAETFLPIEVLEQEDLVTSDVFTSGQVKLMPKQVSELPSDRSWLVPASSLVFHMVLIFLLFSLAIIFPHHEPTQAELEAASRELGIVYLPNSMFNQPRTAPKPAAPSDKLRVDPGLIKKLAPEVLPTPAPGTPTPPQVVAPRPVQELPSAPVPQNQQPNLPPINRSQPPPRFEAPKPVPDAPTAPFKMPSVSPGRALEDSIRGAAGRGQTPPVSFGGAMPRGGGGGLSGGGGGAGDGFLGGGVQMLTPDQGVDFSSYLNRVVDRVRREWYSTMPESARMGDRGRVVIDFKIMRDGSVPLPEPILRATSTKEPLDRAALSAIRGSSPFEQLPSAFSGPYIELRFIFFYNYRPEEIQ